VQAARPAAQIAGRDGLSGSSGAVPDLPPSPISVLFRARHFNMSPHHSVLYEDGVKPRRGERVVKEIFMLRARWRELETELRTRLNGHEGGNFGYSKPTS